jgi:protease-4
LAHFDTAWMSAVGKGRHLDRTVLRGLLTRGPVTMKMAVSSGLVDAIADQDGIEKLISEELGVTVTLAKGYRSAPRGWRRWGTAPKIAIVPVIGTIATGKNRRAVPLFGGPVSGAATFAASLRALEDDASFAGVVIRVDSPGGGLLASDLMHRAIKRLAAKKPVVVSFGNTAASGGYYLAVASPWIMATPLTITGSVGVFAGKVDLSGLYQTLGIQTHTTTSQPGADVLGSHRSWTQGERERLKARLGDYYERFLTLVSEGRKLSMQATREVAGGRVFDGDRALGLRMVDGHGTLWDALQRVSREAELTEAFEFIYLPESSTFGRFLGKWPVSRATEGAWDVSWLSREVSDLGRMLAGLCLAAEGGVFALLPFEMRFQ